MKHANELPEEIRVVNEGISKNKEMNEISLVRIKLQYVDTPRKVACPKYISLNLGRSD